MKLGRNAPCPCGSGKKYKFCCLNKPASTVNSNAGKAGLMNENKYRQGNPLLMTHTDEIYQPVRIHYELSDKSKVLKTFSKLRCIDFDQEKDRWIWLYDDEARNIKLEKPYTAVPVEHRPIVIGSFYFREENRMHLDVRSIQRATAAILFFDKYIPRTAAKVRFLDIVNRLFGAADGIPDSFDIYFDSDDIKQPIDPDEFMEEIKAIQSRTEDIDEKRALAISYIENQFSEPFSGVERLPVHYYEEGISSLETSLIIRQSVAIKHWFGDTDYTIRDFILSALRHHPDI